ncbi:MAG: response regulator [Chloroflexi bacterium]|nr:response regulator [Chloroflexota bacterium]
MEREYRILVVDDEKNIRLTLGQTLQMVGYQVQAAVNGEDALKQLATEHFDLMLLDLRMPGMDGIDVLRQAMERRPEMRIVIVTAHGSIDTAVEAMKIGAVDFIQKPFSPQEIRTLVAKILDPERQQADYEMYLALARRNVGEQHYAAAREQARRAIAGDSARPEAFNLLGVLHDTEGDHHTALVNYRIALDLDPTYEPARRNMTQSGPLPRSHSKLDIGDTYGDAR